MRKWLCIAILIVGLISCFAMAEGSSSTVFIYDHIDGSNMDAITTALLDVVFNNVRFAIKSDGTYSLTSAGGEELGTGKYTVEDSNEGQTKTYSLTSADSSKTITAIMTDETSIMLESPVNFGSQSYNCNVYYKIADEPTNTDESNSNATETADVKEAETNNDAGTATTNIEPIYAVKDSETTLFDQNGVRMTLTGATKSSNLRVELGVVIENHTSNRIVIKYGGSINGWSIGNYNSLINGTVIEPNTKAKDSIAVYRDKTEVSVYNDLKDMNLYFKIENADNGKEIFKTDYINVVFNSEADKKADSDPLGIMNSNGFAPEGERLLIFEKNDIAIYLDGDHKDGSQWIELPVTVVNKSDKAVKITYSGSVNGWSLNSYTSLLNSPIIEPGTSAKSSITFDYDYIGKLQYKNLKSADLKFKIKTDTGNELFSNELFSINADTIYFNVLKSAADTSTSISKIITYSDKETIKKVQQALNDAGYNCGTPDGISGKKTKAAIRKYRTANDLGSSDAIDSILLNRLGITNSTDGSTATSSNL